MKYFFFISLLYGFQFSFAQQDSLAINKILDEAYEKETTNPTEALKLYKRAYSKSQKSDFKIGITKALQYSGIVYSDLANYDSAIYYYNKALPYSIDANYKRGTGGLYVNLGNTYQYKGEFSKVIPYYIKGIKIFEILKDSSRLALSYENLSGFYSSLNNPEKEIEYLKKTLLITPKKDQERLAYALGDLGLANIKFKNFSEAHNNFQQADKITKTLNDKRLNFFSERNFGEYYYAIGQFKKAIPYYDKAKEIVETLNEFHFKNDVLLQLGKSHAAAKNYAKAMEYFENALKLAKANNILQIQETAHLKLSRIYDIQNNPEKALFHLKENTKLKDSLLNETHLKQINLLEKQYQSEKKDKELAKNQTVLKNNQLELAKNRNKFIMVFISGIILLIILVGLWIFYAQRQKLKNIEISRLEQKHAISKLEALIEGEEKERMRLAQDLHDGINGDLSSIKFQLSSIDIKVLSAENKTLFNKAIAMIDDSCDQVRNISHNLSPTAINDFGLINSVKNYCSKLEQFHSTKINFQHFGNDIDLSNNIETVIYRIIQELVNNIIKHAKATEALVQINSHEDTLFITVEDNGIGFNQSQKNTGIGLKNIASRIAFLNAVLEEDHNPNGTTFSVNIDLKNIPKV